MRAKWRVALSATLIATLLTFVSSSSSPVGAEINSDNQTSWGLATLGNAVTTADSTSLGWAVEVVGNTTFVGGNFLNVTNGATSANQPYFAAFDADTGVWQSWVRPNVSSAVFSILAAPDGGVFVGGEFTTWNGVSTGPLVKIDPATGELWPGWNTRVSGTRATVRDMKIEDDGRLYIVGDFTTATVNGSSVRTGGAMRVNPSTGAIDSSWLPIVTGGDVWGVSRSRTQNRVYLAGQFTQVNASTSMGFAGVSDSGALAVTDSVLPDNGCAANANTCHWQFDVEATEFGTIWIGGVEHALRVLNESNYSLARQHYTACDPARNDNCSPGPWFGGDFQEIERVGDRIYATCHCWYDHYSDTTTIVHTQPTGTHSEIDSVAAYSVSSSQRITSFRPYLTGAAGGWGLAANPSDGCLWMTGGIQNSGAPGSQTAARNLVRLCDSAGPGPVNLPDPGPPSPTSCTAEQTGNSMRIDWTGGGNHTKTIVERRVSADSNWFWRAAPNAGTTSLTESVPNDTTVYRVSFRYSGGQTSSPIVCTSGGPAVAPTSCVAVATSSDTVNVSWSGGSNASSYLVFRSANGGGRAQAGSTGAETLNATAAPGGRYVYDVVAVSGDGSQSAPTQCGAVRTAGGSAAGN